MLIRTTFSVALLSLIAVSTASAQGGQRSGRADLRYVAPMPAKLSYVSVDSTQMLSTGMPTGEMTINANLRSVVDIAVTPGDSGMNMKAQLKELSGNVETPMGSMPVPQPTGGASAHVIVAAKGLDLQRGLDDAQKTGLPQGMDAQALIGRSREIVPLLPLPGRELAMRETWTDTLNGKATIEGLTVTMQMIVRGTYERDTVIGDRTLNVLAIQSELQLTSNGMMQGMQMDQTVTTTAVDNVLWDSRQHALVSTRTNADMKMNITMPGMGNISMTGKIKSTKQQVD